MDFSQILTNVFAVSPLAGVLLYFLRTVWLDQRKDRAESNQMMKDHNANMLTLQKESITAINNNAEAQRQLAGALTGFESRVVEEINEIKLQLPRNGNVRRLPTNVPADTKVGQ